MVYQTLGRCEDVALLFKQTLANHRALFDDHLMVAVGRIHLVNVLEKVNRSVEAFIVLQQSENTFAQHLGEQHPNTINARSELKKIADLLKK